MVINFSTEEALAATGAVEKEALVYTTGADINGKVQLAATSNLRLSDSGVMWTKNASPVSMEGLTVTSSFDVLYPLNTAGDFVWDIAESGVYKVRFFDDANITFTNVPIDTVVPITLFRITGWGGTATKYTFNVGTNEFWHNEESLLYAATPGVGSMDIINGFVMSEGVVLRRPLFKMYIPPSNKNAGSISFGAAHTTAPTVSPTPNVSGVEQGMIITSMANSTLNANALKTDGVSKLLNLQVESLVSPFIGFKKKFIGAAPTLNIDTTVDCFIFLNHNVDITAVNINVPNDNLSRTIVLYRTKDDTPDPRTIYFDPAVFKLPADTSLTQAPLAKDIITVYCKFGIKTVTYGRNFGTPVGTFKKGIKKNG